MARSRPRSGSRPLARHPFRRGRSHPGSGSRPLSAGIAVEDGRSTGAPIPVSVSRSKTLGTAPTAFLRISRTLRCGTPSFHRAVTPGSPECDRLIASLSIPWRSKHAGQKLWPEFAGSSNPQLGQHLCSAIAGLTFGVSADAYSILRIRSGNLTRCRRSWSGGHRTGWGLLGPAHDFTLPVPNSAS